MVFSAEDAVEAKKNGEKIEDVLDVIVVEPEPLEGPTFEHGLQDEDVTTALDENYDPPS